MVRSILTGIFILVFLDGFCQNADFTVVGLSGSLIFQDTHQTIKKGTPLHNGDRVHLVNGHALLVCSSSSYIKLDTPGLYIMDTKKMCLTPPNTSFLQLIKYEWGQLSHKENPNEWRDHLDNIGAVRRGGSNCTVFVDSNLNLINYYTGDFNLSWHPANANDSLYLRVYKSTSNGNVIIVDELVHGNTYPLTNLKAQLKKSNSYFWIVEKKGEECQTYNRLNIIPATVHDSMINSIVKLVNETVDDKADQQLLQGVLMEQARLFADAYERYKEAVKFGKGEKRFRGELDGFEKRYKTKCE